MAASPRAPSESSHRALRLNLGCGSTTPAGWLNVDSSPGAWLGSRPALARLLHATLPARLLPADDWPAGVTRLDLTRAWPFADASAEVVYASHFLEHLAAAEARHVLAESRRVLHQGGRLRLVVPDLAGLLARYESDRKDHPAAAAARFVEGTGFFDVPPPATWREFALFRIRRKNNHRQLFDEPGLLAQVESAGFTEARRRAFRDSDVPGIEAIDVADRFEHAICVEARRP